MHTLYKKLQLPKAIDYFQRQAFSVTQLDKVDRSRPSYIIIIKI